MQAFRLNVKRNHDSYEKIRDEKLQYDINSKAAKISALSSGKTDKEKLPSDQSQIMQQTKFQIQIHLLEKHLKSKQKQLKVKEENKLRLHKS